MLALMLNAALLIVQAATPAVKPPETPAGQALTEFVNSFNAGGDTRRTWLETRTTLPEEPRANILKADAAISQKNGPMTVVRILEASASKVVAVVRHATSGAHGHLTIDIETAAPFKVVNLGMRAATPEEIKGGGRSRPRARRLM